MFPRLVRRFLAKEFLGLFVFNGEFAARLAKLCAAPPTFRNLDILRDDTMLSEGSD